MGIKPDTLVQRSAPGYRPVVDSVKMLDELDYGLLISIVTVSERKVWSVSSRPNA
jgi:hypothetical protein